MKNLRIFTSQVTSYWKQLLGCVFLSLTTIASGIALMACSGWLITMAAARPSVSELAVVVVGVRFFGLARAALRYAERLASHYTTLKAITEIRVHLIKTLSKAEATPLTQTSSAQLLGRIVHDVNSLNDFFHRCIIPFSTWLIGSLIFWAILFRFSIILVLVVAGIQLVFGFAVPILLAILNQRRTIFAEQAREHLGTKMGNTLILRNDITSANTSMPFKKELKSLGSAYSSMRAHLQSISELQNAIASIGGPIATVATVWICAPEFRAGAISGPTLAALAFATLSSIELFAPVGLAAVKFLEISAAKKRIASVMSQVKRAQDPQQTDSSCNSFNLAEECIASTSNVSFLYPKAPFPAVKNVNINIPTGKISFLSGPSGCGKSTLVEILAGIKQPTSGAVSRTRQHALGIPTVRDRDHIFSATLRENITIGNSEATDTEIELALKKVDLEAWYSNLPQKLDTRLGECGSNVSGGERQRILLARALTTQKNALIIDECTSHLPEEQETKLVCEFAKTKTILFVGHRTNLQAKAEQRFAMNNGSILQKD